MRRYRNVNTSFKRVSIILYEIPSPSNLGWAWSFGSMTGMFFVVQVATGSVMSFYYDASVAGAFSSVVSIQRDVYDGWMVRNIHSNGASFIFVCVYIHIARGIYYTSYGRLWKTWTIGVCLYFLLMGTAFFGYVLPWGQMSYWGATVITNMPTIIPVFGDEIVKGLWGGYALGDKSVIRFCLLHYLLPGLIGVGINLHMVVLHLEGSSNPLGVNDAPVAVTFHPYYTAMDLQVSSVVLFLFVLFVFGMPQELISGDNLIPADPLKTPITITPEWYFLPFYTILRSIPHKTIGILTMFASVGVLFLLPLIPGDVEGVRNCCLARRIMFWAFLGNILMLGYLGACPIGAPYLLLGAVHTGFHFFYFLCDYVCMRMVSIYN